MAAFDSASDQTLSPSMPPSSGAFAGSTEPRRHARERRRLLLRRARQALAALVVLSIAVLAALALQPRPVLVDLAKVGRGPLVVAIEETGITRVKDRFDVSAPATGTLARIALEPGDTVREGDVLAEIAPTLSPLLDERARAQAEARLGAALSAVGQAQAQSARAAAALAQAEREVERTRLLTASGTFAPQALEDAEFALRMRQQELASAHFADKVAREDARSARVTLGSEGAAGVRNKHLVVLAPVSGTVLRVHQKSAGVVQVATPLLEVGNPEELEVVADLLTTDAVRVKGGTPVQITGWGGERRLAGRVRRVEPSGFTRPSALGVDEQRVNVVIALTEPREHWAELADGYHVEARIVLWEGKDVLKVPQGAVFRRGDGWAAFRVQDGRAHLAPLQLGHRGGTEVEIVFGLAAGDAVAIHAADGVKDRVKVEAR